MGIRDTTIKRMKLSSSLFSFILENPRCTLKVVEDNGRINRDVSVFCMSSTCSRIGFACQDKLRSASVEYADCNCTADKCELDLKSEVSCELAPLEHTKVER